MEQPRLRLPCRHPAAGAHRPSATSPRSRGPAKTHAVLRPPPGLRRSAPTQLAAGGHPGPHRRSRKADRSPPQLGSEDRSGGAASCGPHTLHPSTAAAAAAPELCAPRPGPSRAHNFGSPVGLLEVAESAPSPDVRPSPRHRAWGVATESEISSRVQEDRPRTPSPHQHPSTASWGKTSCFPLA